GSTGIPPATGDRRAACDDAREWALSRDARGKPSPARPAWDPLRRSAGQRDPDSALERVLDLLDAVSRRGSYLALLEEYPRALKQLATLMGASPWVAQYLTQHPILLDELLDSRTLYATPDWPAAARQLEVQL